MAQCKCLNTYLNQIYNIISKVTAMPHGNPFKIMSFKIIEVKLERISNLERMENCIYYN